MIRFSSTFRLVFFLLSFLCLSKEKKQKKRPFTQGVFAIGKTIREKLNFLQGFRNFKRFSLITLRVKKKWIDLWKKGGQQKKSGAAAFRAMTDGWLQLGKRGKVRKEAIAGLFRFFDFCFTFSKKVMNKKKQNTYLYSLKSKKWTSSVY